MRASNKRLTILSELDQYALYDQPDFDDNQRAEFLTFTEAELTLILSRPDLSTQIYCAIQLGYFKAKQFFFRFSWEEVDEENIIFIVQNYFHNQVRGLKSNGTKTYAKEDAPVIICIPLIGRYPFVLQYM